MPSALRKPSIALVGAGAMGGALLRLWLRQKAIHVDDSVVFDPFLSSDGERALVSEGLRVNPGPNEFRPDILVLAIKPQLSESVLPAFSLLSKSAIPVSIMAGRSVATIKSHLKTEGGIIRAMPNLPVQISEGATGLFASTEITEAEFDAVEGLMSATGKTVRVDKESDIDTVTAISGSGPAYVFLMVEALSDAAVGLGLSPSAADMLARQTIIGAGAMLNSEVTSAAELRRRVTSPKGTTEAALQVLGKSPDGLRELVQEAAHAAYKRAGELTK